MDPTSRLHARLAQIPSEPSDPESLADLLVCAFGAFERYYLCWRTAGGEFRQDAYDLPPLLQDWLFPDDGTTRDFATLQVVFGRGEEYFASDKDGKLEYKEPEIVKSQDPLKEDELLDEKPSLRRSRTVSFRRPLSDPDALEKASNKEGVTGRRSQSVADTSWRPTSLSTQRSTPDPTPISTPPNSSPGSPPPLRVRPKSTSFSKLTIISDNASPSFAPSPEPTAPAPKRLIRRPTRPLSVSFTAPSLPIDANILKSQVPIATSHCTCCRHNPSNPLPSPTRNYTDSSTQTSPSLRLDTSTPTTIPDPNIPSATTTLVDTPLFEDEGTYSYPSMPPPPNPILYMGRMLDYFTNPGYQLGDSLVSSYPTYYDYGEPEPEAVVYTEAEGKELEEEETYSF